MMLCVVTQMFKTYVDDAGVVTRMFKTYVDDVMCCDADVQDLRR